MSLRVARDLELPDELVVEKQAILAMSGAGKSNAAVVMAEAMYDAGLPWVVIDPKGDWWGVRAGRGGRGEGLRVPVLGGLHGDVPLEATAGKVIANLIASKRLTCVLDVSEFDTRQDLFRFLADFAETLLKRNTQPLHVFAEEADDYLPQVAREKGNLPRCLGAWQRLVKRGRQRGIGSTLITQRSASINKDVLNMTDTLIVMRTVGIADRKTVKDWVTAHDGNEELLASLPSLGDGEAWVYSPQKLRLNQRIRFNRRRTFDSGATPLLGEKASKVATLSDIDLDALKDEMADTIERQRADDPNLLRQRIKELERDLAKRPKETETVEVERVVEVEVPVLEPGVLERLEELLSPGAGLLGEVQELMLKQRMRVEGELDAARRPAPARAAPAAPARAPAPHRPAREAAPVDGDARLGKAERKVLTAILNQPGASKDEISLLTGYRPTASTIGVALSNLRRAGLVELDTTTATDAGREWLGDDYEPLPSGPALLTYWRDTLGRDNFDRKTFDLLVEIYPQGVTKEFVQDTLRSSRTASTIGVSLAKLKKLRLLEKFGSDWRASEIFMAAIR